MEFSPSIRPPQFCHPLSVSTQVLVDHTPGILTLTLNRPERRNALTLRMLEELCDALKRADHNTRVIILTGAGTDFSSGFDLAEGQDLDTSLRHGELLAMAQLLLAEAQQVTLAVAKGFALAGGGALIAACDYAVATVDARFGYPVLKIGIVPTPGMPFLRHEMKERDFRELVLGGELKDGAWAATAGLVNKAFETVEEANAEAERFARVLLQGSPEAVRTTKKFAHDLIRGELRQELQTALAEYKRVRRGPEAVEGLAAFNEKRQPVWPRR